MTKLNDPTGLPTRPASVAIGELAIAGGLVGEPLLINYQSFPAMILCDVWKHFNQGVGGKHVQHIRTQRDITELEDAMEAIRMAIVHSERLCNTTSWTVQMSISAQRTPTVFCASSAKGADDVPGTALVLTCTDNEVASLTEWLAAQTAVETGGCEIEAPSSVQYDPHITALIATHLNATSPRCRGLRESRILRGLLAGACVLRSSQAKQNASSTIAVNLQDYDLVRNLLCSQIVKSDQAAYDPLTVAMIGRANVFMAAVRNCGQLPMNESEQEMLDYLERYGGNPTKRELITRRELADLGNVNSTTVRMLIERLQQKKYGRNAFRRMGLTGKQVSDLVWKQSSARELARRLRPWSVKQVRTHFDRLQKDGLITAEREASNRPWRYRLPEELSDPSSPFSGLPTAQDLEADSSAA
jgi:predicted transcriptional regulator